VESGPTGVASFIAGLCLLAGVCLADVVVSQETIRDKKGRPSGWTAVRMDSGRRLYEVRFSGRQVGLGPGTENWYGNGFLQITLDGTELATVDATLSILDRGPDVGRVRIAWPVTDRLVTADLELRDADDKLLATLDLPAVERRRVRLMCYPSSFGGGYRPGKDVRRRRTLTAAREIALGDEHAVRTDLTADEPWALFVDDHFDRAQGRGSGPCAALSLPHETEKVSVTTGNYACWFDVVPKPDVSQLHLVLWDLTGMSNAAATEFMKGIELTPTE